jgi:type VI secretion system secreted protein Hcp
MAVDMFLKITDVRGESQDAKHKGEIEIESFSWGVSNSGSAVAGGGGGKAAFQDFSFTTGVSAASPQLFLACASGQHLPQAVLVARKAGGDQLEFLKVTMSDVLISSYQTGGSGADEVPLDQVSLNFAKIEFAYTPQAADGTAEAPVVAGWDLGRNRKI